MKSTENNENYISNNAIKELENSIIDENSQKDKKKSIENIELDEKLVSLKKNESLNNDSQIEMTSCLIRPKPAEVQVQK